MGMTLIEKLVCKHAEIDAVAPGDQVSLRVNRYLFGEKGFFDLIQRAARARSKRPRTAGAIIVGIDQMVGIFDEARLERLEKIQEVARKWRIQRLYEWGEGGIETVLFIDGGLIRPGDLVAGGSAHMGAFGCLGALALHTDGKALFKAVMKGRYPLEVPETVRLVFHGAPGHWVNGKDFAIQALGIIEPGRLAGKAVEITGEAVRELDMPDRLALAAFAVHLGGCTILVEVDEKTEAFARARSDRYFKTLKSDPDASFAEEIDIDVDGLEPQIYLPSREERVIKVSRAENLKVDHVVIGTGGNGRIEDLRIAAGLLREHQINRNVHLVLIPGSQQVYLHAMEEGLIQLLMHTGTHIGLPSNIYSDLCHINAIVSEDCLCLSTAERIYGPQEIRAGQEVIYCNPAVAAASAVMGRVSAPFEMMRVVKRAPTGLIG